MAEGLQNAKLCKNNPSPPAAELPLHKGAFFCGGAVKLGRGAFSDALVTQIPTGEYALQSLGAGEASRKIGTALTVPIF